MIPRSLAPLVALAAGFLASPAPSADPPGSTIAVELSNFAFAPATIELVHGRAYALQLTNTGSGGHNFAAPRFFAAAAVDPADRRSIRKGGIEVGKGATVTVRFTAPAAGHYDVRCTHFLHSTFGMKGEIVVS
ncbi:cupredoxin domain-containing protein [Tsuneonella sp. YG55]|uniref:Cupredoxin domain-containing protein n=1 Tax=Tsuneonella litorea TaxID=2976475 RepID=A0A9X2W314_9SPHN|nr:cupredoxin domain-containing protein [Tsuneonella litorea]MCT2558881.1 cupredoxin domain-containing protein [Tsuneonella litorea]